VLYGDLAEILALCALADHKGKLPGAAVPGSQLSVVAGIDSAAHNYLTTGVGCMR
jgi:hypothetical protein